MILQPGHKPLTPPDSPPRGLKDILRSQSHTDMFRKYLLELDEELGSKAESNKLDFVLSCRKLKELLRDGSTNDTDGAVKDLAESILRSFFDEWSSDRKVALENQVLRQDCGALLKEVSTSPGLDDELKARLRKTVGESAYRDAYKQLETNQMHFILQNIAKKGTATASKRCPALS